MKLTLYYRNRDRNDYDEYGSGHYDDMQEVQDVEIIYSARNGENNRKVISLSEELTRLKNNAELNLSNLLFSGQNGCFRNETYYYVDNQFHDDIRAEFSNDGHLKLELFENSRLIFKIYFHENDISRVQVIPKDKKITIYGEPDSNKEK